ncbi:hypothetical protein Hanom_Chr00s083960g01795611 [Helianthus anomalus]
MIRDMMDEHRRCWGILSAKPSPAAGFLVCLPVFEREGEGREMEWQWLFGLGFHYNEKNERRVVKIFLYKKTNHLLLADCRHLVHLFSCRCLQMWSADCRHFSAEKTNNT